jgi:hypothetical protein
VTFNYPAKAEGEQVVKAVPEPEPLKDVDTNPAFESAVELLASIAAVGMPKEKPESSKDVDTEPAIESAVDLSDTNPAFEYAVELSDNNPVFESAVELSDTNPAFESAVELSNTNPASESAVEMSAPESAEKQSEHKPTARVASERKAADGVSAQDNADIEDEAAKNTVVVETVPGKETEHCGAGWGHGEEHHRAGAAAQGSP